MRRLFISLILLLFAASFACGAPSKGKEKEDYVWLRISARVVGNFNGTGKEETYDSENGKLLTGLVTRVYQDKYTTSYTSMTKWRVIDLDQGDDVAALERVSDRPDVSGSGQGSMKVFQKNLVYGPYVKGKRKSWWETTNIDSTWTYKFPQKNNPFPAQVRLHKRAKTFRVEMNAVGPEMPEIVGSTVMDFHSKDHNETKTLDHPSAVPMGSALCTMSQTAAIPLDKSEKRLTGKFDCEKPNAVSGSAVFNASEIPSFKMLMDQLNQSLGQGGSVSGDGKLYISYTLAWNCEPEDIDAIIVPKDGYESWKPQASTSTDAPGNTFGFEVKLIDKKTGKEPKNTTAYFKCNLSDTTKEPGSCMNSPSTGTEFDLKILKDDNSQMETVAGDGQSCTSKKELKTCPVSISCYDGAAFGRISVTAYLSDGSSVVAHMDGKADSMDVALPCDENGNRIADCWEDANECKGKSAALDEDQEPLGDHDNGDGLTIWEEYRGFLENDKYFRTDPRKKDYFICDTIGGKCKRAINRFAALTKLEVHDKLKLEELSQSRVINRNRSGDSPHSVDQHGILIVTWSTKGLCMANSTTGEPSVPKNIDRVLMDSTLQETVTKKIPGGATKTYEYYEPVAAHELLHACNVWHHGQVDKEVYWKSETVAGVTSIYEYNSEDDCGHPDRGIAIKAYNEENGNMYVATSPFWSNPISIWRGEQQGQHSGNEDCVMRYDCANAYYKGSGARYCMIWTAKEPVGEGLCTSPTGTGVNAPGRAPACRYGDAASDKGDCIDTFCVNDLYH